MAYDEVLADRVREMIALTHDRIEEKRMFGGLCFMVDDKMCIGVEKDRLMVRLDPDRYEEALSREGAAPMDFTGRVMKGYVFVDRSVLQAGSEIRFWVDMALEFNAKAKPSAKRKPKS